MVHLTRNGVRTDFGVQVVCKVEHRSVFRQRHEVALRREHDNLGGKQVQFYSVEEVDRVRSRLLQQVGNRFQPRFEFRLLVAFTDFVFPVGCKTAFSDVVHLFASDLHLHPVSVVAHHRQVQRTVSVGLRRAYPVACSGRVQLVNIGNCRVYAPANRLLVVGFAAVKHDSHSV